MKYVNVVIDNNNDNTDSFYTYGCEEKCVKVGSKVYVPFALGNRIKAAYVFEVKDQLDKEIKRLKNVESVDSEISLNEEMINVCIFMKKRYGCRYIDAISCFTPSGTPSKRGKKRIPFPNNNDIRTEKNKLTEEQTNAMKEITPFIGENIHKRFLIHGVTGSGKTELYMRIIEKCLEKGKSAIMMVPEISLTKQIIERFIGRFGSDAIAVLHSRLSMGERYDEWVRIKEGQVKIVIGARSAAFAPLENIGVIVMDEEHEATYKSDMAPKYDTVEIAIKRTKEQNGILLLGSATPSTATYRRANEGIYQKITLKERYNKVSLPKVDIVDMRQELLDGNKSVFSQKLYDRIVDCLKANKQIIIFLNRRGYSTFVSCRECGYVMKCPECGISMTYHKGENKVICHYCGAWQRLHEKCPECESKYIKHFGTGTEKIEESLCEMFPNHKIARLDLDTIKKKGSLEKVLDNFEAGKSHILIGTQIVAKGLDFKNVGLVGIISADVILNIPDFRSAERTFQLITQAAGRAGRGEEEGKVIIQTYSPEHYAVQAAAIQDYEAFYNTEIEIREALKYPPFGDIIEFIITSEEESKVIEGAEIMAEKIKTALGRDFDGTVFAPQSYFILKFKGIYKYFILVKCPKGKRTRCMEILDALKKANNTNKKTKVQISIDVNPY